MVDFDVPGIIILVGTYWVVGALCTGVEIELLKGYLKKPKGVVIGLVCQFVLLPAIAFGFSKLFELPNLESIGLIITGSTPGGTSSNFWCMVFGSDLELSIACTTSSSLLSFLFLTVNILIYINTLSLIDNKDSINIDYASMAISIAIVIVAILSGLLVSKYKNLCLKRLFSVLGVIFFIVGLIISTFINSNAGGDDSIDPTPFYELPLKTWLATLSLNFTAWMLSLFISKILKLTNNQAFSIAIECSFQNIGLSIAILYVSMDKSDGNAATAIGIPLMYGSCTICVTIILGLILYTFGYLKQRCILEENDFIQLNYSKVPGLKLLQYWILKFLCRKSFNEMKMNQNYKAPLLSHKFSTTGINADMDNDPEYSKFTDSGNTYL